MNFKIDNNGYNESVVTPGERQKLLPSAGSPKQYGGTSVGTVNQVATKVLRGK